MSHKYESENHMSLEYNGTIIVKHNNLVLTCLPDFLSKLTRVAVTITVNGLNGTCSKCLNIQGDAQMIQTNPEEKAMENLLLPTTSRSSISRDKRRQSKLC